MENESESTIHLASVPGSPVACTLTSKDASRQALEWVDLQGHATAVEAIDGGARMTLPSSLAGQVEDLVRRESCLLYTSPSPRDATLSRMPSSA